MKLEISRIFHKTFFFKSAILYIYHIYSSLYCVNMTVDLILKNDNQGPPNVTIRLDFFDLLASVNLNGLLKNWRQQ